MEAYVELSNKDIIKDTDPRIREHSEDVELPLSEENRELLLAMHQYVADSQVPELAEEKDLSPAVGIAAIQLGIPKKMIAVVVPSDEEDVEDLHLALANPKIISRSAKLGFLKNGEGCLSVPDAHEGIVCRPMRIKVRAYDLLTDQNVVITAQGYEAVVLQHEIDHLSGKLFYDHIDPQNPWHVPANANEVD